MSPLGRCPKSLLEKIDDTQKGHMKILPHKYTKVFKWSEPNPVGHNPPQGKFCPVSDFPRETFVQQILGSFSHLDSTQGLVTSKGSLKGAGDFTFHLLSSVKSFFHVQH